MDLIDFDYPCWHTPEDTLDKVSAHSLKIVGMWFMPAMAEIDTPEISHDYRISTVAQSLIRRLCGRFYRKRRRQQRRADTARPSDIIIIMFGMSVVGVMTAATTVDIRIAYSCCEAGTVR